MHIYQVSIYNLAATGSSPNLSQRRNGIYAMKILLNNRHLQPGRVKACLSVYLFQYFILLQEKAPIYYFVDFKNISKTYSMRILIPSSINKNSISTLNYIPSKLHKAKWIICLSPKCTEEMDEFSAFLGKPKKYILVCQV